MALLHRHLRFFTAPPFDLGGRCYVAGKAPDPSDPSSIDGRFRMVNVPSVGRIVVLERSTLRVAGTTLSRADGTWRIDGLSGKREFLVLGLDDQGRYNAAVQDWVLAAEA